EFSRSLKNVDSNPREALSAASNILESICKIYISENSHLEMPAKKDLPTLWNIVRVDLKFDHKSVEDADLKQILSGLISVVKGIGDLRTHASSAHGQGKNAYRVEPRHARLAVHAAHTMAFFVLETWQIRKSKVA
ncbi:MAG: abortive infection family protein, partial [Asticcacaulis sp.]